MNRNKPIALHTTLCHRTCRWAVWERWQRRLARQRPLEVDSDYPRGITARFHCLQEPVDTFRPFRRQVFRIFATNRPCFTAKLW